MVKELRNRARDVLLTQAIASEETLESGMPADDLLLLEGMKPDLALALARRGVRTREDLADQAVDDLLDIEGLTAEEAGKLIMKAREHLVRSRSRLRRIYVRSHRCTICRSPEGPGRPAARAARVRPASRSPAPRR